MFDFEMLGKIDIFVTHMLYLHFFKTISLENTLPIDRQNVHDLKLCNTLMLIIYLEQRTFPNLTSISCAKNSLWGDEQ